MNVTVRIPDDVARRLQADGADISRRVLEGLAAEEYRAGRLTNPELCQMLGFETLNEMDGFLKAHGIFEDYSVEDLDREIQALDRLGL